MPTWAVSDRLAPSRGRRRPRLLANSPMTSLRFPPESQEVKSLHVWTVVHANLISRPSDELARAGIADGSESCSCVLPRSWTPGREASFAGTER